MSWEGSYGTFLSGVNVTMRVHGCEELLGIAARMDLPE
jgi:hypothetical protein